MIEEEIDLEIYFRGKFVIEPVFKYEGGDVMDIYNFDVDKLSYFELKGCIKELSFDNVVDLYYEILGLDLKSNLRKGKIDIESIDMVACVKAHKALIVFTIHELDEPRLIGLALLTQDTPIPSSLKSMVPGSTYFVSSKFSGPRVKHTLDYSPLSKAKRKEKALNKFVSIAQTPSQLKALPLVLLKGTGLRRIYNWYYSAQECTREA
ncbi:hypothetical protein Cgig2_018593 [Carnegiea gigantea]|uniref:PB1-like domain-containing protein n=1 Tax=Carnegiea gigantea TaxID=171969 RepID=A0A9Q1K441_9CARY|nr:hypothetical protein Cgig2_018593 [Carnegiea gigantea]